MTSRERDAEFEGARTADGSPLHGYQGDRAPRPAGPDVPAGLTVAVSREAGSRGGSIARRAARKLGWEVYNQELLEYIAQEGPFRRDVTEALSAAAAGWAEERLRRLQGELSLGEQPSLWEVARVVLALGAQGNVVLVGRGAGRLLPPESTLHVRIVAPWDDRVAYMSQWLRLTVEQAAEQVRLRDARREEFLATHFGRPPGDVHQYDLLLNSSLLGEELCAELIARAAQAKQEAWRAARGASV
jgi:cytidylate kinase